MRDELCEVLNYLVTAGLVCAGVLLALGVL